MQINPKSFLLKNQIISADFRPSPIQTRAKQRLMPSETIAPWKLTCSYGKMQINLNLFLLGNHIFSAEFWGRRQCLPIKIVRVKNFTYGNIQMKVFSLKKKSIDFCRIPSISQMIHPKRCRDGFLPVTIAPWNLRTGYAN